MKRNTINQLKISEQIRTLKKNKSCLLNNKLFGRYVKPSAKSQLLSSTVVNLLVNELLDQLTQALRVVDQQKFHESLISFIDETSSNIESMVNPLNQTMFLNQGSNPTCVDCQQEPHNINGDLMCGGNTIALEQRHRKIIRISFNLDKQGREKQVNHSKNSRHAISSKCDIKFNQDECRQAKQPQALKMEGEYLVKDSFEDMHRQRLIRDKQNQNLKQAEIKKQFILPVQQHSFDYDGAILPIKRSSIQKPNSKIVLNTTYKVLNRELKTKPNVLSKIKGLYLKTQPSQGQKENRINVLKEKILSTRRQSNTGSMKSLFRICTENDESLKSKIEQQIFNKAIKIRQLKNA